MVTRRIVISACALSLAVPTTAGAQQATHSPKPNAAYGITTFAYPGLVKAKGPYGTTLARYPKLTKAKGPYGTTVAASPKVTKATGSYGTTLAASPNLVKAKGPFGTTVATSSLETTGATARAAGDAANSWRTAAYSEAALLATLALGSALLLLARRRPARLEI